jgi:flagellar hook-basal body complex protein FliE
MITYLGAISLYNQMQQNVAMGNVTPVTPQAQAQEADMFSGLLKDIVGDAVTSLRSSESLSAAALVDKAPLQDVVAKINEADIALQTVIAIRDKLVGAYQDIIRMPV